MDLFRELFGDEVMCMSYLYSKLPETGVPRHIDTGGTQNAYMESFNGKFRDECLNEHWFVSLAEARTIVAA